MSLSLANKSILDDALETEQQAVGSASSAFALTVASRKVEAVVS
jgi:hypothetical protein